MRFPLVSAVPAILGEHQIPWGPLILVLSGSATRTLSLLWPVGQGSATEELARGFGLFLLYELWQHEKKAG